MNFKDYEWHLAKEIGDMAVAKIKKYRAAEGTLKSMTEEEETEIRQASQEAICDIINNKDNFAAETCAILDEFLSEGANKTKIECLKKEARALERARKESKKLFKEGKEDTRRLSAEEIQRYREAPAKIVANLIQTMVDTAGASATCMAEERGRSSQAQKNTTTGTKLFREAGGDRSIRKMIQDAVNTLKLRNKDLRGYRFSLDDINIESKLAIPKGAKFSEDYVIKTTTKQKKAERNNDGIFGESRLEPGLKAFSMPHNRLPGVASAQISIYEIEDPLVVITVKITATQGG